MPITLDRQLFAKQVGRGAVWALLAVFLVAAFLLVGWLLGSRSGGACLRSGANSCALQIYLNVEGYFLNPGGKYSLDGGVNRSETQRLLKDMRAGKRAAIKFGLANIGLYTPAEADEIALLGMQKGGVFDTINASQWLILEGRCAEANLWLEAAKRRAQNYFLFRKTFSEAVRSAQDLATGNVGDSCTPFPAVRELLKQAGIEGDQKISLSKGYGDRVVCGSVGDRLLVYQASDLWIQPDENEDKNAIESCSFTERYSEYCRGKPIGQRCRPVESEVPIFGPDGRIATQYSNR
jgi:hypothetical protein